MRKTTIIGILVASQVMMQMGAVRAEPRYRMWTTRPGPFVFSSTVVVDYNRDGRRDVILGARDERDGQWKTRLFVYLQRRDGELRLSRRFELPMSNRDVSMAKGHLNRGRRPDVAIATDDGIWAMLGRRDRMTRPRKIADRPVQRLQIQDMNRDGRDDIVASMHLRTRVLYQTRSSGFRYGPKVWWRPLANLKTADVTGDGRPDVIGCRTHLRHGYTCWKRRAQVFKQKRDGSYRRYYESPDTTEGIAVADVTDDGRSDVVVTNGDHQPEAAVHVYKQLRSGRLAKRASERVYELPEAVVSGDMNGDRRADVVVVHHGWDAIGMLLQRKRGGFRDEILYPIPTQAGQTLNSLSLADLNRDGRRDILMADSSRLTILYSRR